MFWCLRLFLNQQFNDAWIAKTGQAYMRQHAFFASRVFYIIPKSSDPNLFILIKNMSRITIALLFT